MRNNSSDDISDFSPPDLRCVGRRPDSLERIGFARVDAAVCVVDQFIGILVQPPIRLYESDDIVDEVCIWIQRERIDKELVDLLEIDRPVRIPDSWQSQSHAIEIDVCVFELLDLPLEIWIIRIPCLGDVVDDRLVQFVANLEFCFSLFIDDLDICRGFILDFRQYFSDFASRILRCSARLLFIRRKKRRHVPEIAPRRAKRLSEFHALHPLGIIKSWELPIIGFLGGSFPSLVGDELFRGTVIVVQFEPSDDTAGPRQVGDSECQRMHPRLEHGFHICGKSVAFLELERLGMSCRQSYRIRHHQAPNARLRS